MPLQYRAIWNTAGGGTGYTVWHMMAPLADPADAQDIAVAIRAFYNSNAGLFPDEVSIVGDDEVLDLADDGTLLGVFPVSPSSPVVGTQTTAYNRAAGIRVDLATGEIVSGRRLNGRVFLVPASVGAFDANGLVNSATITAVNATMVTLRNALFTPAPLAVWSRTHQVTHPVISNSVPPKGAILRGRRD